MPFNGSGTFSLTNPPISYQALTSSTDLNEKMADLVAGLNSAILRDGQASALTTFVSNSTQVFAFDGTTSKRITLANLKSVGTLTRAEALALAVTTNITVLGCYQGGVLCLYEKDASGTALTTADGQKWSPMGGNATPAHWANGLPGSSNDATTAIQAMFDWTRTKWDTALGNFTAWANFAGQAWRCTSPVGQVVLRQPGFRLGNGALFFDMTSGIGLQLFGTNSPEFIAPFRVEGTTDPTACPEGLVGIGVGSAEPFTYAIAPSPKGQIFLDGCASKFQVCNLGSEVSNLRIIGNGNSVQADTSTMLFSSGDMQDAVDIWGAALTSALVALPTVAYGPFSNILHDYGSCELKRQAYWNGTITGITLGATTTVAFTVTNAVTSAKMADGQELWIGKGGGGGVVELEQAVYTVASLTLAGDGLSGTLVLSGVDSTSYTSYSSGGSIWAKTGPFAILGLGRGHSFGPRAYGLSYGTKGLVLHARNGGPQDVRWSGQTEYQVKYPVTIDVGTGSAIPIQGLDINLLAAAQNFETPFQVVGTATLSIRDLKFTAVSHTDTFDLFTNGGATTIINAEIRTPTAVDVSGLASFSGVVHTQSPASIRMYATKSLYMEMAGGQITMPNFAMQDKLFHDGDTDTAIRFPAADTLTVETGGSERLRVGSSGNVGIGNNNPSFPLDVSGADDGAIRVRALGTSSSSDTFFYQTLAGNTGRNFQYFGDVDDSDVGILAYHHTDDSFRVTVNAAERLRVTSTGAVGIGETAPDYTLDVNGAFGFTPGASVTPAGNGDVVFELTDNTTLTIKAKGSDGVVRSGTVTLA